MLAEVIAESPERVGHKRTEQKDLEEE